MSIYSGRRPKTWRVIVWSRNRSHEFVVEGTKKDAMAFEARKRVELAASKATQKRAAPTFADFCADVYEPHAKQHLKESTWSKVRRYQVATLCEHFGSLKLNAIATEDVDAFKARRTAQKRKPSVVNNELRVLRTILNFAAAMKYPCSDLKFKRLTERGSSRPRVWSEDEIARLFSAAKEHAPDILPMLVFLANTGCRKGEALAAEWTWIDFSRGLICIPSNPVWQPKNGKPREIPISDTLRAMFATPLEERAHARWLFVNRLGAPYADFPKDRFWMCRAVAKLTGGPHSLRHSFASLFLARRPDMFLLAEVLGHTHTRVTQIYSHLLPEHLEKARNVVDLSPTKRRAASPPRAPEPPDEDERDHDDEPDPPPSDGADGARLLH